MIKYEDTTPPTDEQMLGNEYVGFQLGYFQSPDMGIKRINTNNRYQQSLVPNFELKTNQDTKIGTRLYKQEIKDKQIRIDFAFDSLTQNEFDQVKNWLGNGELQPLQFYEDGQVIYVKLQGQPTINYICFNEEKNGIVQRIYKGEGSVNFIQYKFNVTKAKKKYQDLVLKYVDFEKSYYDSTDEIPLQIHVLKEEFDPYNWGPTARTMAGDINRYHIEYKNNPSDNIKNKINENLSLFYPFKRIGYYRYNGDKVVTGPVIPNLNGEYDYFDKNVQKIISDLDILPIDNSTWNTNIEYHYQKKLLSSGEYLISPTYTPSFSQTDFFNIYYYKDNNNNYYIRPSHLLLYNFSNPIDFILKSTIKQNISIGTNYTFIKIYYPSVNFYTHALYTTDTAASNPYTSVYRGLCERRGDYEKSGNYDKISPREKINFKTGDNIEVYLSEGYFIVTSLTGNKQTYELDQAYLIRQKNELDIDKWFSSDSPEEVKLRGKSHLLNERMMVCDFENYSNYYFEPWEVQFDG